MAKDQQVEGGFYRYMHQSKKVDPAWNREVLSHYIPYFAKCQSVLDVGCGQGEFLELLRERGVEALGIDVDVGMVDACLQKGLPVVQVDVFEHLSECREQFDGIFCSNVIEHMPAEEAMRFVHLAFSSLTPGGRLIVATPNPASLVVHLHEFWRDATHVRLYDRSLLEFLLDWAGFLEVRSGENPVTSWETSEALKAVPGHFKELASLRKASYSRIETSSPRGFAPPPPEARATYREAKHSPKRPVSWIRRRDKLVTDSRKRSFLGRLVLSMRRGLARLLADAVLFEEFAALNGSLSELTDSLTQASVDLTRDLEQTSNELTDLNRTLSKTSVTIQEIEKALYESHSNMLVKPREIFARGLKPFPLGEEAE